MHRSARLVAALSLALGTLAPAAALGQQDANIERGFASAKGYQGFEGPDSINEFNGNLVIGLPFPAFHANGGLVYGLTLTYNAKIWTLTSEPEVPGGPLKTKAELSAMDNAGAGWLLTLGELLYSGDPRNVSGDLVYVGPDGGEHRFYNTLHIGETTVSGKCYARDGSYLRLNGPAINCQTGGNATTVDVEFPDGRLQRFTRPNTASPFRLADIRDRFGNSVVVTPFTSPTRWRITDGHRTHWVYFTTVGGRQVVDKVVTGNLAVTYLGSYNLHYSMANSTVLMTVTNRSSAASGFRPPVLGYTRAWDSTIGQGLNNFFSSGPMSATTQTFSLTLPCP